MKFSSISWEEQYLNLIAEILRDGDTRVDRTGVGTKAIFGKHLDIDLSKGFPAVTTKKLAWKAVTSELLWFLEGTGDERRLAEILHGSREGTKTIWTDNAEAAYWLPKAKYEGDLGRVYGVQWRNWQRFRVQIDEPYSKNGVSKSVQAAGEIDQVAELVNKLKTNPTDRRMIVSAWNVGEIDQMALPPCHMMAQFFVANGKLSCSMYQRSVDTMLGLPFNIASYALLTHMLAQVADLEVGRLIMNLGDTHIYTNHLEGALEQIGRIPTAPPTLVLNPDVKDIDGFKMGDFVLEGYNPQASIKMEMAV